MDLLSVVEAKRDGRALTPEQIDAVVSGYVSGEVPDYVMSAWLMAVFFNGMDLDETVALTDSMIRSGDVVDLAGIAGPVVDKHSTGGVADTTTLVLVPMLGALGCTVAKMSGRGLGFTGGTLDKLESIPGFRVDLGLEEMLEQVSRIGVAVVSQSERLVPADKLMYALRDVTGTVPSVPLIASSILSKKIAGGADVILIDVKVGSGAFMKDDTSARHLAETLVAVGERLGRTVTCVLTDMDAPLGRAVGNSLEVAEAIEVLRGRPGRLADLCEQLAARILVAAHRVDDLGHGLAESHRVIADGSALQTMRRWIEAQGGDPAVVDDPASLPSAAHRRCVTASRPGFVSRIDAESVGRAASLLGAGRTRLGEHIDPSAGLVVLADVGTHVEVGSPVFELHTNRPDRFDSAFEQLSHALVVSMEPPAVHPTLIG